MGFDYCQKNFVTFCSLCPFSLPAASRVRVDEGHPELCAAHHVHEEVGGRVYAHEKVAEGDEGADDLVGLAVVLSADEPLVDVRE